MSEWGIVDIHGTAYHTVAKRVADFREQFPDWTIKTRLVELDGGHAVFKALIYDSVGKLISTGWAQEESGAMADRMVASMLEVAETSAVGRALAFAGYGGSKSEIASADEIQRRNPESSMSRVAANKVMRQISEKAFADDALGVQEVWDELTTDQQIWLMNNVGRPAVEKINACLESIQSAQVEPDISGAGSPLKPVASEKDTRREKQRARS